MNNPTKPEPGGSWRDLRNVILFRSPTDDKGFLSNFHPSPLTIQGDVYHHVEGWYQSSKFTAPMADDPVEDGVHHNWADKIRRERNPRKAKVLADRKEMTQKAMDEWDNRGRKEAVMETGLRFKFQDEELKRKLLATGRRPIAEETRRDRFWGIGTAGDGENRLGLMLMQLRYELQQAAEAVPTEASRPTPEAKRDPGRE